jgi:hypothetical protein
MYTTWRRRLYAAALLSLPVVTAIEGRLAYYAQGGAHQSDGEVGDPAVMAPIAAHQSLWLASTYLVFVFGILLLPGVLGLLSLTRERLPKLTAVCALIALPGVIIGSMEVVIWNVIVGGMAISGAQPSEITKIATSVESYPPALIVFGYPILFNLALILLAGMLWRSRAVPWWAALCLLVEPLNEILPSPDGWAAVAISAVWMVGTTYAAFALLRGGLTTPSRRHASSLALSDSVA